VGKMLCKKV